MATSLTKHQDQTEPPTQLNTMDEFDIYVNVETPSGNRGKMKKLSNEDEIHTQKPERNGSALSGGRDVKKISYRAAAVCLGLLCLLLLIGLIILVFLYTKSNQDMVRLQTSYNNLTEDRDQLQNSYNNLTKDIDQLQNSYNNLTGERDRLQKGFEDMTRNLQGWVYFSGSFYYISSSEKSWQESRNDCQQKHADLMIINSKEKQEFARRFKKRMWIGLTDRETEGTWKWVDGTQLTTSYWLPSEPNGDSNRDEDCAEIKSYELERSWNDESCDVKKFWICERTLGL